MIELQAAGKEPAEVPVTVKFHRRCLRMLGSRADTPGPWEPGQTAVLRVGVPGGLVFVERERPAMRGPRLDRIEASRILPRGTADEVWCYNSAIYQQKTTLGGRELPAVIVSPGRFRGYADLWVEVAPGSRLKFETGYQAKEDKKAKPTRPLRIAVRLNGSELWSELLTASDAWQPHDVPLESYAGRKVLMSFSAEVADDTRRKPSHLDLPAVFGNVRVEGP